MEKVVKIELLSRSLGPTCSNVEYFYFPIEKHFFRAYGVPGGAILVQWLPVTKHQLQKQSVMTQVVIDGYQSSSTNQIQDVELLAFANDHKKFLAAASSHDLAIYDLHLSHHHEQDVHFPKQKNPAVQRLLTAAFPGVVAMSWTGDGCGLLLSDNRGRITCIAISLESKTPSADLERKSMSQRQEKVCSMEILWVEKFNEKQTLVAAGYHVDSEYAVGSKLSHQHIKIVQSGQRGQEIEQCCALMDLSWSPEIVQSSVQRRVSLLTVGSDDILRIWMHSPNGANPALGAGVLEEEGMMQRPPSLKYHLAAVIELKEDAEVVPGSLQATWLQSSSSVKMDSQLSWIISTYTTRQESGTYHKMCRIYAVHGLPIDLCETQIGSSRIITYLKKTILLREGTKPDAQSLHAFVLDMDPDLDLLVTESLILEDQHLTETHTVVVTIKKREARLNEQDDFDLCLDCQSKSEIVGFASQITHVAPHPKYDLACVLTEERVMSLWDLWPIRKLISTEGTELGLTSSISTVVWMNAEIRLKYQELGYLIISGDQEIVVCLVCSDLIQGSGKPTVSLQQKALFSSTFPIHIKSLTQISSARETEISQKNTYIARSKLPDVDQESYYLISIKMHEKAETVIEVREIVKPDVKPYEWTVMDQVYEGVIVGGTQAGTLEFCTISPTNTLQQISNCVLSPSSSSVTDSSFVSCLSVCHHASYLACVTSFDVHQNEDKIHILQSESTNGGLDYRLEDSFVSSSGIISQISWVQTPSPVFYLVIGYEAGQVDIVMRTRQRIWMVIGTYLSSLRIKNLATTYLGLPIIAAGRHMLFLSNESSSFASHLTDDVSVMQAALSCGGPLAEYHPVSLLVLFHMECLDSACGIFNKVEDYLKEWEKMTDEERKERNHPLKINGPSADLEQSFVEPLIPNIDLFQFGAEIVHSVPFLLKSEEKPKDDNLAKEATVDHEKTEDTSLMTGQFDMSAFGMEFDNSGFSSDEEKEEQADEKKIEFEESKKEENHLEENGHNEGLDVMKEACLFFALDPSFNQRIKEFFSLQNTNTVIFDKEHLQSIFSTFITRKDAKRQNLNHTVYPLDCLLRLSESNLSILSKLLCLSTSWTQEMGSLQLDTASLKFMTAVKLISCAVDCQPPKPLSKQTAATKSHSQMDALTSPFLKLETQVSLVSEASVASSNDVSFLDDRLGENYVSWPERVGITPGIESVHILWAIESQDPYSLLQKCVDEPIDTTSEKKGLVWEKMKALGAGFWLKDKADVARVAEEIAREQFRRHNDPHDCALLYIALKKQNLLSRLFRGNGFSKVADLLTKDFALEQNQKVASKNAFVLLGQHRFSLAAAFFLVGGFYKDAISVCFKEMQDPQLALFLATLLDESTNQLKHEVINKDLYPQAIEADDRVAQGVLMWLSGQYFEALDFISTVKALKAELSIADRAISKILLFQFVFCHGLPKLSERYVPLWMFDQIRNLAAHCAHVLETVGLPLLAVRALQTTQFLTSHIPKSTQNPFLEEWMRRLVTSIMIRHLPSLYAVNARDPAMILWHQHVQQDVDYLNQNGLSLSFEIILHQMQYIMDCLYEVPCAPVFPKEISHPPELSGPHSKAVEPGLSKRHILDQSRSTALRVTDQSTEKGTGKTFVASECYELLQVDGDRCVGVCYSNSEEFYGIQNHSAKRVAAATGKYGIHFIDCDMNASHTLSGTRIKKSAWPSLDWLKNSAVLDTNGQLVSMKEVQAGSALKAHPSAGYFLSGSGEDSIFLWKFDADTPYAEFRLDSKMTGFNSAHRLAWNSSGDRFAAISQGGICGHWRIHSANQRASIGYADWSRQVGAKRGHDVEFVEWSGSVIATSGEDEFGKGIISLWDTLAPSHSCRIAHFQFRNSITELTTIPGTLIFLSAQESGSIMAHDFRMMQSREPQTLWSLNSIHDGPITSLEAGWAPSLHSSSDWEMVVATGGKDGDICITNGIKEKGELKQRLHKAHWRRAGQFAQFILSGLKGNLGNVLMPEFGVKRAQSEASNGTVVLDLDWCDEGLLTAGADGYIQLYPWTV